MKKPRVSITERQQQTAAVLDSDPRYRKGIDAPFGLASHGIDLKDRRYVVRWFNNAVMADHVWRNKQVGWDEVRPEELLHPEQAGAFGVSETGTIRRGERGQEVLLKIPKEVYHARQLAKTEQNLKDMKDFGRQQQQMLQATAEKFGSQAAEYVNAHLGPIGGVRDTYERIEVAPEGDE